MTAAVVRDGEVVGFVAGVVPGPSSTGWVGADGRPFVLPLGYGGELAEVPGDARIGWVRAGGRWVPPHLASVEAARAWALARLAPGPADEVVVASDGVAYRVGDEAQRSWALLLRRAEIATKAGVSIWPQPFEAADGTLVVLDDLDEAEGLFAELFDAANGRRRALLAVTDAIERAATPADVVAVLRAPRRE